MKKLLLVFVSILMTNSLLAQDSAKNEITDSFTDKVSTINENDQALLIQFSRHASIYKISKSNPHFSDVKAKLEKLKKEEKKVKVTAIIPIMEIKEINE